MSPFAKAITGLFLLVACGHALGQSTSFGASLLVLPEHTANGMPVDLPTPPQARNLPASRDAKRLLYGGNCDEAKRFYEGALPELGFHLARQDANGAVWERADVRAELRFFPVVGQQATGIYVTISPKPLRDAKG